MPSDMSWRHALLEKQPWLTFLLPLLVYMVVNSLEPTPETAGGSMVGLAIPYGSYPLLYSVKIALTVAAVVFVLPGYRQFPLRISPLAIGVGVIGVVIWVGLCALHVDEGTRSGFNPHKELAENPIWAWGFLTIRFVGLAVVVPVIEEFFLRGFVMRFVMDKDWSKIPIGTVNTTAIVLVTVVAMATHTGELLAAAVWFSMVTWLLIRTRNIWDCVAAHAVTNLLLGIYVVVWDQWHLM